MAQIINFPNESERDWLSMEASLREVFVKDLPDGPDTWEECLPSVKAHWKKIFVSFSVQPSYSIPGPVTEEQLTAVNAAVEHGVNLMADRLRSERAKYFSELVGCEFKAAYFRRNGGTL